MSYVPPVNVNPTIKATERESQRRIVPQDFGPAVLWPLAQNCIAGFAAFMLCYSTGNLWAFGRVWVGLSLSPYLQVSAWCAVVVWALLCLIRFSEELQQSIAAAGERFADRRNQRDAKDELETIAVLYDKCRHYQAEIQRLEVRLAAVSSSSKVAQRPATPRESAPVVVPKNGFEDWVDPAVRMALDERATLVGGSVADEVDQTIFYAEDIIETASATNGNISREACRSEKGLTRRPWEKGIDLLQAAKLVVKDEYGHWSLIYSPAETDDKFTLFLEDRRIKRESGIVPA